MISRLSRRQLIQLGASGLSTSAVLGKLPMVSAQDAHLPSQLVNLDSGIEPVVQLIERTNRSDLMEVMAQQVTHGLAYQQVLAALLLAGVRNVQPRPAVGFKFHSVLVVHSAHLASLASADSDRWLPIFWALDYFKATQLEEEEKSGWKLHAVNESLVPSASKARQAFVQAMDNWDAEAGDVATAALARTAGANELFELFCRYGARDYRSIGHKAIYVANSFRTLHCIGWQHAEPVLRSLAYALQNHTGEDNPARNDHSADRAWRENLQLQSTIPADWQAGKPNIQSTREMISQFRTSNSSEMCQSAVTLLQGGVAPQSIWDAVLLGSGELLMQQPGIIGIHSLTTANALHYAYQTSGNDETRRLMLLQACAFLPLFRSSAKDRGSVTQQTLENLTVTGQKHTAQTVTAAQIFERISNNRMEAAELLYGYLQSGGDARLLHDAARRLIFLKGRDAHDYKFSSAVLEDVAHVSPALKNEFLALSVFNLRGSGDRDNGLVDRIRTAL